MPPITAVPIATRLLAPAPVAIASGSTPKMKAKLVIRIGRRRMRAASSAASITRLPDFSACSANSIIRIAFWAAIASIRFIASPELLPGADWPEISYEEMPLKRLNEVGAFDQEIVAKEEKGTICPLAPRTYHLAISSGDERYGASPWT